MTPWYEVLAARRWSASPDELQALEQAMLAYQRCVRVGHEWVRRRWWQRRTCALCRQPAPRLGRMRRTTVTGGRTAADRNA